MRFLSFLVFPLLLLPFLVTCGKKDSPGPGPSPIDVCQKANAGPDVKMKAGSSVEIGKNDQIAGVSYNWFPADLTMSPNTAKTFAKPLSTAIFMLKLKNQCGTSYDYVKVKVEP